MKVKMMLDVMVMTLVVGCLLNDVCFCLPTTQVADQILSNIIKDLETAVYKLKVYADSRSLVGSEEAGRSEDSTLQRHVQRTSENTADGGDVTLQEALKLIADLAKQNKPQKRDHDIPFPFHPERK